jgi:hypothetical protein
MCTAISDWKSVLTQSYRVLNPSYIAPLVTASSLFTLSLTMAAHIPLYALWAVYGDTSSLPNTGVLGQVGAQCFIPFCNLVSPHLKKKISERSSIFVPKWDNWVIKCLNNPSKITHRVTKSSSLKSLWSFKIFVIFNILLVCINCTKRFHYDISIQ